MSIGDLCNQPQWPMRKDHEEHAKAWTAFLKSINKKKIMWLGKKRMKLSYSTPIKIKKIKGREDLKFQK